MSNYNIKELSDEKLLAIVLPYFSLDGNSGGVINKEALDSKIINYIRSSRIPIEQICLDLEKTRNFLKMINMPTEILGEIFLKWPAFIRENFTTNIYRYLILGKIINPKTKECDRDNIILSHPSAFTFNPAIWYARIKYLMSDQGKNYMRTTEITYSKAIKRSHSEFESSYKISAVDLLKIYPFNEKAIKEILNWPINDDIKSRFLLQETSLIITINDLIDVAKENAYLIFKKWYDVFSSYADIDDDTKMNVFFSIEKIIEKYEKFKEPYKSENIHSELSDLFKSLLDKTITKTKTT